MSSVKDMTTYASPAPSAAARMLRQLGIDTQYVLVGFPIGLLTVTLCMTLFFTGVGLTIIWVGLPILLATFLVSRAFATLERVRIRPVLAGPVPHPHYKKAAEGGVVRRTLTPLADGQSWLDLVHGMFRFIPS